MNKKIILASTVIILLVIVLSQITFFVVQPIGAIPNGKTLVVLRMNKTNLIDSADAMCYRTMGSVNLLCRGMMMAAVVNKGTILLRLPYSRFLYEISTGGKVYGE